jgi:hypothetical protein
MERNGEELDDDMLAARTEFRRALVDDITGDGDPED